MITDVDRATLFMISNYPKKGKGNSDAEENTALTLFFFFYFSESWPVVQWFNMVHSTAWL